MSSIRIKNVLKDLNVGLSTVVEFLNKKGQDVDSNPNTKITAEQAELCINEFAKDLSKDERSALLDKLMTPKTRNASKPAVEDNKSKKEQLVAEEEPKVKETDKKDTVVVPPSTTKVEKVVEEKGPKVIGKIDLEPKKRTKKVDVPKNSEIKQTSKEETKVEKKQASTPTSSPKADTVKETPKETKVKEVQKETETPEKKVKDQEKKEIPSEKAVEGKKKEEKKKTAAKETTIPVAKEAKEDQPSQPKKQEDKSKSTSKETPKADKKGEKEEPEMIGGNTHEIKLKVVGKIELSQFDTNSRTGGKKGENKKKRKRINKKKVDIAKDQAASNNDSNNKDRKSNRRQKQKPEQGRKSKRQQQLQSKPEVTQEDIQKQIKETLAQMQNKNKRGGSQAAKYRKDKREAHRREQDELDKQQSEDKTLRLTEYVTANDLAQMIEVPVTDIITMCFNLGLMVSINQRLEKETIDLILDEYGYEPEYVEAQVLDAITEEEDKEEDLKPRAPIVTVMGHVDHGKTKLLDCIRNSDVASGEAGGITQHVGAYSVTLEDGRKITFLDTPGHEAFTAMRARGAKVTDIVIVVVAADDGVMPQTKEAINHASIAGVPIIFAINKIDKPHANPDRIKEELSKLNYLVEDWGGKYQSQNISAKNNIGIKELLEKVLLEAELLDLKANPDKKAIGSVLESTMEVGRGYTTKVLIQEGTLHIGDHILAGTNHGRVKALFNERGKNVESVGPAEPVKVLGLNGATQAGEAFNVLDTEQEAREIANKRTQLKREQRERTQRIPTLQNLGQRIAEGNIQELNIIVKGDVDGSVEALSDSIVKLSTEEIRVNVIHKAVGQISDSDVVLAAASDAVIIGFQVRPAVTARRLAETEGVEIRTYSIIYTALDDVKNAMEGMLSPEIKENVTANIEVRETFKISKVGTIAGCMVKEGKVSRSNKVRIIRDGIVIFTGALGSLKRFKDDVKEVTHGYECGLNIENFNDIAVGDIIEAYEEIEVKKKL